MKWLVILGVAGFLIVGVLGLALTYLFPSDFVRQELERQLSSALDGRATIASLSFNALTGLELRRVTVHKDDRRLLALERLNLDYSLLGLFGGTLLINEVLIDRAVVAVNLPETVPTSEPAPPPTPSSRTLPVVPLAVDLHALIINEADIDLTVSPDLAVVLTNLNLDLSGSVGRTRAAVQGVLDVDESTVDIQERRLRLPLHVEFSLDADLPNQLLELHHLAVASAPVLEASFSGRIQEFLAAPKVDLTLDDVTIDVQPLLALAEAFLPANVAALPLGGKLALSGHVQGAPTEAGFQGVADFTLDASALHGEHPDLQAALTAATLSVRMEELTVRDNALHYGTLTAAMSDADLRYRTMEVTDAQLELAGEFFAAGPFSGTVKTSGVLDLPPLGAFDALTLPFAVQLDASGNPHARKLLIENLSLVLEKLLSLHAKGEVRPAARPSQGVQVSLATRLEPRLASLLPLLPPSMMKGVTLRKADAPDVIVLDVTGDLDSEYRPRTATLSAGLKLAHLTASLDTVPAGATLDHMNMLVSAKYSANDGQIKGTAGSRLMFSNLHQGESLAVGQTDLTFKSHFTGTLDAAFAPTALRTEETVKIELRDLIYDAPALKAGLDRLTIKTETAEDVFARRYRLKTLHIRSDPLIELTARGAYHMPEHRFDLAMDLSRLNIGEILRQVSGDLAKTMTATQPEGTMEFTLTASGRVPDTSALESWTIPVQLESLLTLSNVSGAFANHRIAGANGSVALSVNPAAHPVATLATTIRVQRVDLADLPVKQVPEAFVTLDLEARDFDEVRIESAQLGMRGVQVALHGVSTGLKPLLAGASPTSLIERLFARLAATASVDLAHIRDILAASGVKGSGTARIDLSILKKERGPLDVKLDIGAEDVNLALNGTAVADLDGRLSIQKHLAWQANSSPIPARPFNPSDVLAQLQALGRKGNRLTIRRIDSGGLTLTDFSTNLLFDQSVLKVQNVAMNLLGGGLGGNIVVKAGKPFGISARLEAAQLDLNELVDERHRIPGDSKVDATMDMALLFDDQTGALDLGHTTANVYITHIGREALDRLLVFLDPEGSNPTLMAARAQVRLANPSRVTIQMARGLLGLDIAFSEGLLSSFTMNRIPVGNITELRTVTQRIPHWEDLVHLMALVGASAYGVDADGHLRIE